MPIDDEGTVVLAIGECYNVEVYHFPNGMFAVCDVASGQQVPELQGMNAREKIRKAEKDGLIRIRKWNG
ncbi:MAG: hypothetical protein WC375_08745 [Methanomassiliicoccales archaeon]|jgi:hypothetical protein